MVKYGWASIIKKVTLGLGNVDHLMQSKSAHDKYRSDKLDLNNAYKCKTVTASLECRAKVYNYYHCTGKNNDSNDLQIPNPGRCS